MNKKRAYIFMIITVSLAGLIAAMLFISWPQSMSAQNPCPAPEDLVNLPEAKRRRCENEIANTKMRVDATERARIESAPRNPLPTESLSKDYIAQYGTPIPEGIIPKSQLFAQEILAENRVDGEFVLRPENAQSVWRAGATIDARSKHSRPLYIYTPTASCGIVILTTASSSDFPNNFYPCPKNVTGNISITSIDITTYTIFFKSQNGYVGSFNAMKHAWQLS